MLIMIGQFMYLDHEYEMVYRRLFTKVLTYSNCHYVTREDYYLYFNNYFSLYMKNTAKRNSYYKNL